MVPYSIEELHSIVSPIAQAHGVASESWTTWFDITLPSLFGCKIFPYFSLKREKSTQHR